MVPFEVMTSRAFAARAAAEFEVEELRDGSIVEGYRLSGPCPRCEDPMEFNVPLVLYRLDADTVDEPLVMFCRCERAHLEGEQGCGAYWSVEFEE